MKTTGILRLTGVVLLGLAMTAQINTIEGKSSLTQRNVITLSVDRPIIEFVAKANADRIDAEDILRMHRMTGRIDYLIVNFRDPDASDYILKFKDLDDQGLEDWMFNEGYLSPGGDRAAVAGQEQTYRPEGKKKLFGRSARKAVDLTIDKSIIEYLAKIYSGRVDAKDIVRLQRLCCQIDHVTITFKDEDASDYVLHFKPMDKQALEAWMFSEGYLVSGPEVEPEPEMTAIEPWMLDMKYLE